MGRRKRIPDVDATGGTVPGEKGGPETEVEAGSFLDFGFLFTMSCEWRRRIGVADVGML